MKAKKFFSMFALVMGVFALVATTSCKKNSNEPGSGSIVLSKTTATVEIGKPLQLKATLDGNDITASTEWTSSNPLVAHVAKGVVGGVSKGNATITVSYDGKSATCAVTVTGSSTPDKRLDGSKYIVLNMDETTFGLLGDKVEADLRLTGSYDENGNLVPEDANGAVQVWNPKDEIVDWPNIGTNSFGRTDEWFGTSSANPKPEGGWGNIAGGYFLKDVDGSFDVIRNKITSDHVFCIAVKGKYTASNPLEIGMKMNGVEKWPIKVTESTGEEKDGDWSIIEYEASKIFNFKDLEENSEFFTIMFRATGSGNTVDLDAAFFYVPAE